MESVQKLTIFMFTVLISEGNAIEGFVSRDILVKFCHRVGERLINGSKHYFMNILHRSVSNSGPSNYRFLVFFSPPGGFL